MMKPPYSGAVCLFLGLMLTLAAGCAATSPKTNFYLLSTLPDEPPSGQAVLTGADGLSVGIGPVTLPDYLDRPQIVIRTTLNEITLSEFDRWAEPLKNNFIRVFRENLADRLKTDDLVVHPWPQGSIFEFQVTADVIRFDARPGDEAVLDVRWSIWRANDRAVLLNRKSTYRETVGSTGYEALVAAQSRALAAFSREVGASIVAVYRREHGQ